MKIAVSAEGTELDSAIHQRFGRCPYFLFVDTRDMGVEVVENPNADLAASAGIQSASLVAAAGATTVITGNCGPKAMQVFDSATISVITGQQGSVASAVQRLKAGRLSPADHLPTPQPAVTGSTAPPAGSRRSGMGCGGGGRGRGMGQGRRCRRPAPAGLPDDRQPPASLSRSQERSRLQAQAEELKRQMAAIQSRINDLA